MPFDALRLAVPTGFLSTPSPPEQLPDRLSINNQLVLCEIHDVVTYASTYIVKGAGLPRLVATVCMDIGGSPIGLRDATTLTPGAQVLCWINTGGTAVILGVVATPMGSSTLGAPDSIVACGNAGIFADKAHQDVVTTRPDANGVMNASDGRPIDVLPGDWGKFNAVGMGILLGKLMMQLRATDACKLELFQTDQLARLVAYNWQLFTAGSEEETLNDEGEWSRVRGSTPYPWEALGVANPSASPFGINGNTNPLAAAEFGIEPNDSKQKAFWRYREFEGFLGDVYRRFVMAPREGVTQNAYGDGTNPYVGLFEEHVGADGAYRLSSAKQVLFERTLFIPVPEDKQPRDHPDGDRVVDADNAAGLNTTLTEPAPSDTLNDMDRHAAQKQKLGRQGFNLRTKDWAVDDPPSMPGGATTEQTEVISYDSALAPEVDQVDQKIDHRRNQRFYKGKSFFELTDDGGFVIQDAYGSEIRSYRGDLTISCPGNMSIVSGKDARVIAGGNTVVKSQKSVDISAAEGDVRLKAERNLMALGGNSGTGGVLVENRGEGETVFDGENATTNVGGLVLKSSRGALGVMGRTIRMKSTGGPISLDAASGDQNLYIFSKSLLKYLKSGALETVAAQMQNTPADRVSSIEHTSAQVKVTTPSTVIGSSGMVLVNPYGDTNTSFRVRGSITAEDGSISATGNVSENMPNPNMLQAYKQLVVDAMDRIRGNSANPSESTSAESLADAVNTFVLSETSITGDTLYNKIGVSFRSTEELSLTGSMPEVAWQKRFRVGASGTADSDYPGRAFHEPVVCSSVDTNEEDLGPDTLPFPGYDAWTGGDVFAFARYDDKYYDWSGGGVPKPATSTAYDDGLSEPVSGKFEDRFPVNTGGGV
jgi:hypothetical protein